MIFRFVFLWQIPVPLPEADGDLVEAQHDDEEEYSITCIWEWEQVTNVPTPPSASISFVGMPQIEQGTINCRGCKCLVVDNSDEGEVENSGDSEGDNSRDSEGDRDDHEGEGDNHGDSESESDGGNSGDGDDTARSEDSDDDTPQFPETVKVVGSPFETRYQEALAIVEEAYAKGEEPPEVRVELEPDNCQDTNAIKVECKIANDWRIIGYIPKHKIPKFTLCLRRKELVSVKFLKRPQMELHPYYTAGLTFSIVAVKVGRWYKDVTNYTYRCDLSNLRY